MNITWYGLSCFKLQGKDVTLITDPFSKETGLKPPMLGAEIVTISHEHAAHNNRETIKGDVFVVDGPGEYENKKVVIRGIESHHDQEQGVQLGFNTIYTILLEDIKFCHLGDLGQKSLDSDQLKAIGEVDVLFVPVGGGNALTVKEAQNVIGQIEPRMVIPMHYRLPGLRGGAAELEDVKGFCSAFNLKPDETVSKVTLKKKDLPEEEAQYLVMDLGK